MSYLIDAPSLGLGLPVRGDIVPFFLRPHPETCQNQQLIELEGALARCRDAFPRPEPGSKLEVLWVDAMSHPGAVPVYLRAMAVDLDDHAQTDDEGAGGSGAIGRGIGGRPER